MCASATCCSFLSRNKGKKINITFCHSWNNRDVPIVFFAHAFCVGEHERKIALITGANTLLAQRIHCRLNVLSVVNVVSFGYFFWDNEKEKSRIWELGPKGPIYIQSSSTLKLIFWNWYWYLWGNVSWLFTFYISVISVCKKSLLNFYSY